LTPANEPEVLKNNIDPQDGHVTIKMIQKRVGEHFGVFPSDLKFPGSSRTMVLSCQVAMYLVKQLTSAALPKIGREFGGKHHTTVLSSIKRIEAQRRNDMDLDRTIGKLFDSLQKQPSFSPKLPSIRVRQYSRDELLQMM
jgi:chromosomal replication initiator protein